VTSCLKVANLFLGWANNEGDLITNLKMQKLLYYAQAWHLVYFKKPLFREAIQAWEFGPVVPKVYTEFKKFGYKPIKYDNTGKEKAPFTKQQLEYLTTCYDTFIKFSAHELVNMVHNEAPWKLTFNKKPYSVIDHQVMKVFYSKLLKK